MTKHIEHHEDVATITVHFHEDELLALAPALALLPLVSGEVEPETPGGAALARLLLAAGDVLHADRAKRRGPSA